MCVFCVYDKMFHVGCVCVFVFECVCLLLVFAAVCVFELGLARINQPQNEQKQLEILPVHVVT